jgi:hypothetical protein
MYRNFEEVGVAIGSVAYGHFTGEAQFDENGQVVRIDVEDERFSGPVLTLDIEQLIRERIALRRKYGVAFLEEGAPDVQTHARKFFLFQALVERLEAQFAEGIREYVAEAREPPPRIGTTQPDGTSDGQSAAPAQTLFSRQRRPPSAVRFFA